MRTQTNTPDTPILAAIIIMLCGCTIIAAAFGTPGSLIAGIVFGLLAGFGAGVWAVGRRARMWAEPQAPGVPPSAERSAHTPAPKRQQSAQSNQQILTNKAERVDPVSSEW